MSRRHYGTHELRDGVRDGLMPHHEGVAQQPQGVDSAGRLLGEGGVGELEQVRGEGALHLEAVAGTRGGERRDVSVSVCTFP